MVCPFLKWTGIAQSVSNASCAGFMPARKGWSATRVVIASTSVLLVLVVGASSSVFIGFSYFSSNEFVFFLADDQHRTRRCPDHAFGCAADREMFPAGITVGRDHDKIDIELFGRFHDLNRSQTGPETGDDACYTGVSDRICQGLQLSCAVRS